MLLREIFGIFFFLTINLNQDKRLDELLIRLFAHIK